MKHLVVCRPLLSQPESPVSVYVGRLMHELVARGERVHAIAEDAPGDSEGAVVHRIPFETPDGVAHTDMPEEMRYLWETSPYPPLAFSRLAADVAERLIDSEGIDIVTAPDNEAPLYALQMGRALSISSAKARPPLIVHRVNPTLARFERDGRYVYAPFCQSAARLESHVAACADATVDAADAIAETYLSVAHEVVSRPPERSAALPAFLPCTDAETRRRAIRDDAQPRAEGADRSGIAVVVTCYNLGRYLGECLDSVAAQTAPPIALAVVDDGSDDSETVARLAKLESQGHTILRKENGGLVSARNAGLDWVRALESQPLGVVFMDADDRMRPLYLERVLSAFRAQPTVGVVTCWTRHFEAADCVWATPCPTLPHQITANETPAFSAIRVEALGDTDRYGEAFTDAFEDWDLTNRILAKGWAAVSIPEVLVDYRIRADSMLHGANPHVLTRMRGEVLTSIAREVDMDAFPIPLLYESPQRWRLHEDLHALRQRDDRRSRRPLDRLLRG